MILKKKLLNMFVILFVVTSNQFCLGHKYYLRSKSHNEPANEVTPQILGRGVLAKANKRENQCPPLAVSDDLGHGLFPRQNEFVMNEYCDLQCYKELSGSELEDDLIINVEGVIRHMIDDPYLGNDIENDIIYQDYTNGMLFRIREVTDGSSKFVYVVALILVRRFIEKHKEKFNGINPFKVRSFYGIFLMAIITAMKFVEDVNYRNKQYAWLSGFRLTDLNFLELKFLIGIDFDIFVSRDECEEVILNLFAFARKPRILSRVVPSSRNIGIQ